MYITFCTSGIVRIRYTLEEGFSEQQSLMIVGQPDTQKVQWTFADQSDHLELSTDLLIIRVCKFTCAFSYFDSNGNLLTKEPAKGGKTLEQTSVIRNIFDDTSKVETNQSSDGLRARADGMKQVVDRQAYIQNWNLSGSLMRLYMVLAHMKKVCLICGVNINIYTSKI